MPRRGWLLVATVLLLARVAELAACGNGAEEVEPIEAVSGPIVFRGWVVSGPTQGECSPLHPDTSCWWAAEVRLDKVIKMDQPHMQLHEYARQEVVDVVILGPAPDVTANDYVEISGEERLFNPCLSRPDWRCDAMAFTVCPGYDAGHMRRI